EPPGATFRSGCPGGGGSPGTATAPALPPRAPPGSGASAPARRPSRRRSAGTNVAPFDTKSLSTSRTDPQEARRRHAPEQAGDAAVALLEGRCCLLDLAGRALADHAPDGITGDLLHPARGEQLAGLQRLGEGNRPGDLPF